MKTEASSCWFSWSKWFIYYYLTLDHFITADELKNVMKRLGQTLSDDEINLMITEADTDGDKQVNYKGMLYHEDLSHKIFNSISISLF